MEEWMNFWCICTNCNATSTGYASLELPLEERCFCGTEMEGFRLINKEENK